MRKLMSKILVVMLAGFVALAPLGVVGEAWARPVTMPEEDGGDGHTETESEAGDADSKPAIDDKAPDTAILPDGMDIEGLLKLLLNIIVYGLGAAATLGVIIAGIMYMTARDNEAQVAKAKNRLIEVVIGLVAWALMYVVLNWLLPGGLEM